VTSVKPWQDLTVVGIGADGWAGLGSAGRDALARAEVVLGGQRHLDLLPEQVRAERIRWPTPLLAALPGLLAEHVDRSLCVLASGDPMWYGVGARIAALVGPERFRVLAHPSAISLACARLGWPTEAVTVVSAVGRDLDRIRRELAPGRRLLVLSGDAATPARLARTLVDAGYGPSELTVLESLGAEGERRVHATAGGWDRPAGDPLNVVGIRAIPAPGTRPLSIVSGLPDEVYDHDGALTKREARALALARLAPLPGQLLWDVGAGSGSVGIEWMRADPTCRTVAVEARVDRAARIAANATTLGVPDLRVVTGTAPEALTDLPAPDAVFVGGGLVTAGLLDACWAALPAGGRLVAHAITIEGEHELARHARRHGGDLTRLGVERAAPLGGFTGWQPARTLVQWAVTRP